jgi:hypothetical protein
MVDLDMFGPCVEEKEYDYPRGTVSESSLERKTINSHDRFQPCIFIKFNKVADWIPEAYDLGQMNETNLSSDFIDFVEKEVTAKGEEVLVRTHFDILKEVG